MFWNQYVQYLLIILSCSSSFSFIFCVWSTNIPRCSTIISSCFAILPSCSASVTVCASIFASRSRISCSNLVVSFLTSSCSVFAASLPAMSLGNSIMISAHLLALFGLYPFSGHKKTSSFLSRNLMKSNFLKQEYLSINLVFQDKEHAQSHPAHIVQYF